jgi:sec-independent protein translocase protein TatA
MLAEIFGADGLVVIAIGVVVFFGATKLPEIARSVGRAQGEFKKGLREGANEDDPSADGADSAP